MGILHPDIGERLAGLQFVGSGSLSRPSIAWETDPDTGVMHRGVQGEFSFVSNGVEVSRVTADGILLPLFTAGSVLFAGTGGTIDEDTGLTYAAGTDLLTVVGGVITAAVGPTAAQQHTLPAVASDTIALLAATQVLTNKTFNLTSNTLVATSAQLATAVTNETGSSLLVFNTSPTLVTPLLGTPTSGTLTNCDGLPISTGVSGLGTGVATFLGTPSSANLITAVTDETGTGALVFGTNPTIAGPTFSGTLIGTYSIGGTPTLISAVAMSGAPDLGTGLARAGTGFFTVLDASGDATIGDQLVVSGVGPHAIGGATDTARQLYIRGSFANAGNVFALSFSPTLTPGTASNVAYGIFVEPTFVEGSSGSHNIFAAVAIGLPAVTAGVATLTSLFGLYVQPLTAASGTTNTAGVYIDAPTGATNNYALWVDAGAVRLDATTANGTVATAMSSLGPAGSNTTIQEWLTININGTVRYIPCF